MLCAVVYSHPVLIGGGEGGGGGGQRGKGWKGGSGDRDGEGGEGRWRVRGGMKNVYYQYMPYLISEIWRETLTLHKDSHYCWVGFSTGKVEGRKTILQTREE